MSSLMLNGHDLAPYMPPRATKQRKAAIYALAKEIANAVNGQLPIGFSYKDKHRLVLPHSLFLQHETPPSDYRATIPGNIKTRMKLYKEGALRAIGIDAFQVFCPGEMLQRGWRTFHLDQFADARLLGQDEIQGIFSIRNTIDDNVSLETGFTTIPDFVRNWNYGFRTFIVQVPSIYDQKPPTPTSPEDLPLL